MAAELNVSVLTESSQRWCEAPDPSKLRKCCHVLGRNGLAGEEVSGKMLTFHPGYVKLEMSVR